MSRLPEVRSGPVRGQPRGGSRAQSRPGKRRRGLQQGRSLPTGFEELRNVWRGGNRQVGGVRRAHGSDAPAPARLTRHSAANGCSAADPSGPVSAEAEPIARASCSACRVGLVSRLCLIYMALMRRLAARLLHRVWCVLRSARLHKRSERHLPQRLRQPRPADSATAAAPDGRRRVWAPQERAGAQNSQDAGRTCCCAGVTPPRKGRPLAPSEQGAGRNDNSPRSAS